LMNDLVTDNKKINEINAQINALLEKDFLLVNDKHDSKLVVSGSDQNDDQKCKSVLEKISLILDNNLYSAKEVSLGTNNLLCMACELLLLRNRVDEYSPYRLLLIEEPEAHLHVQRQLKFISSMFKECEASNLQTIITTHSPQITSEISLRNLILIKGNRAYSFADEYSLLDADGYLFLERFLDATKANLFFARGVILVEGPSESILVPAIAKFLGKSLIDYGISVVNVQGVGFSSYSHIFLRKDNSDSIPISVACITDLDRIPESAVSICFDEDEKKNRKGDIYNDDESQEKNKQKVRNSRGNEQNVKTFVSDYWTLEYDLARSGLHAMAFNVLKECFTQEKKKNDIEQWEKEDAKVGAAHFVDEFRKGHVSKATFAQRMAQKLDESDFPPEKREGLVPPYLKEAIKYVTE